MSTTEIALVEGTVVEGTVLPKKVVKDGQVAVLYSPGFGAVWASWNSELSPFEPGIVAYVLAGKRDELKPEVVEHLTGVADVYCGGARDLEVAWLPAGTAFKIEEYDGSESIRTLADLPYVA